jgi:hypothetical protein
MSLRNFEPQVAWSNEDGTLSERAKGYLRALFDYIGASVGTVPTGSLGGNGTSTTTFLREDGTWSIPAYPTGADPSGTVAPSATNGTALTYMRSDAAPALSLTVPYTFTNTLTAAGITSSTSLVATTGFGCNSKTAQTAVTAGAAVVNTAATNVVPYGYATQAQADDIVTRLNTIRTALIANGILS